MGQVMAEAHGDETGGAPAVAPRFLPSGDEAGSAPEDRAFRPDVEGMRAIAILLVVLFHTDPGWMKGGFIGVDVFFVISGFVITGLLLRERRATGRTAFLTFYARRARRILPAALLVIVVALIATDLTTNAWITRRVASDSRWAAVFLGNFHLVSVDPSIFSRHPKILTHYWSLAVEEQFYLFYPAFFVLLLSIPGRWPARRRLTVGLLGVTLASFFASVAISKPALSALGYVSPYTRGWELTTGCLVALGTAHFQRLPRAVAAVITWAGLAGIVAVALTISVRDAYPGSVAAIPVACTALVIAGGSVPPGWGAEVMLRTLPFRWIGRWSFSWYLWQPVVLILAADYVHVTFGTSVVMRNFILALFALVAAAATYFLVENPVRHSRRLARSPGATLVGAALLIASCFALTYAF